MNVRFRSLNLRIYLNITSEFAIQALSYWFFIFNVLIFPERLATSFLAKKLGQNLFQIPLFVTNCFEANKQHLIL